MTDHTDLLVVGGGLTGLVAARRARRAGLSVTVISHTPGSLPQTSGSLDLLAVYPTETRRHREHPWEAKATFNPAAIRLGGRVHLVYRAMSEDNTSVFGYATSADGVHIDYRHPEPIYTPREEFEAKLVPGGNSGCEDPRLTLVGDRIYMFYTAYDGRNPSRVAVTSIAVRDFLARRWNWARPVVITPPQYDNKDAFLFPEPVDGKYLLVHRLGNCIDYDFSADLRFRGDAWLDEHRWIEPRRGWCSSMASTI